MTDIDSKLREILQGQKGYGSMDDDYVIAQIKQLYISRKEHDFDLANAYKYGREETLEKVKEAIGSLRGKDGIPNYDEPTQSILEELLKKLGL